MVGLVEGTHKLDGVTTRWRRMLPVHFCEQQDEPTYILCVGYSVTSE